jgi:hypothetical protein
VLVELIGHEGFYIISGCRLVNNREPVMFQGRRAAPMRRSRVRPRNRRGGPIDGSMGSDMVGGDRNGGLDVRSCGIGEVSAAANQGGGRRRSHVEASV